MPDRKKRICFVCSEILSIFAKTIESTMTTLELRSSIAADLDLLSTEMLENVSRYVKRLTRHSRAAKAANPSSFSKMEDAMKFVKTLSVTGVQQVPVDERGLDALIAL
jgi:hypothetical protein